jgi:hypothetical protein
MGGFIYLRDDGNRIVVKFAGQAVRYGCHGLNKRLMGLVFDSSGG